MNSNTAIYPSLSSCMITKKKPALSVQTEPNPAPPRLKLDQARVYSVKCKGERRLRSSAGLSAHRKAVSHRLAKGDVGIVLMQVMPRDVQHDASDRRVLPNASLWHRWPRLSRRPLVKTRNRDMKPTRQTPTSTTFILKRFIFMETFRHFSIIIASCMMCYEYPNFVIVLSFSTICCKAKQQISAVD